MPAGIDSMKCRLRTLGFGSVTDLHVLAPRPIGGLSPGDGFVERNGPDPH
jgi:hypothetical protein